MTRDELKHQVSMREICDRYGLKIRRGMTSCPFHGADKHPSMKVYLDGYQCFTCGERGDIFDFVSKMEGCSFREAYKLLGGTYEEQTEEERRAEREKWARIKEENQYKIDEAKRLKHTLAHAITYCRAATSWLVLSPLSDDWCFFQNMLPILIGLWESIYINKEEVDATYVYRQCARVERYFHS